MASKFGKLKLAWDVYSKYLDGVFCVYKPSGMTTLNVVRVIKENIAKGLNELPMFEAERQLYKRASLEASSAAETNTQLLSPAQSGVNLPVPAVHTRPDKFKLVYGNVFITDDIYVRYLHGLRRHSSGVMLVGIGKNGQESLELIADAKYLRVYHVKGRLGFATHSFYSDGKFIERSTFRHVTQGKLDKVCSAAQSGHQRLMFECAKVNPHSQEAYQLACSGLIRPASLDTLPILYGVKCIYFNPPDFTLEVHAINETCDYLAELINDIGLQLKTNAVCVHIHRIRHGYYNLSDTLLHKHWDIEHMVQNMHMCEKHITPQKLFTDASVTGKGISEVSDDEIPRLGPNEGLSARDILKLHMKSDLPVLAVNRNVTSSSKNVNVKSDSSTLV